MSVHVLVVDDEQQIQSLFKKMLGSQYDVTVTGDIQSARWELALKQYQVALIDLRLPDGTGMELLNHIRTLQPACRCILMTGYGSVKTAVQAIGQGAYNYIEKPFTSLEDIYKLIQGAIDSREDDNTSLEYKQIKKVAKQVNMAIGDSFAMRQLITSAYRIAKKKISVLITGETGTGKEVLARFIHAASDRCNNIFIPVNCGSFHENLLESELFGHEKGAFTGSTSIRKGIFELADKGTLFFDELGEASQSIQVKLLRVLETGIFVRLGGEKPILTDVRIITATNSPIEKLVQQNKFREDLYYRLNVVRLEIPPLRERTEDIPEFIKSFARQIAADYHLTKVPVFTELAIEILKSYPWYGNIRELYNVIQKMVAEDLQGVIDAPSIPKNILNVVENPKGLENNKTPETGFDSGKGFSENDFVPKPLHEIEREFIQKTLAYFKGNISLAAEALEISRATLYRKIKQ
ncbi:sigma-54-dependent transcriptional regulator [Desulforamulus aeronauticus]|uniref:Stage 0 sporulation protein A homolog n=1 Tax=Desulforamulus aeronauticus DSM 10349 TaxID=1121421 RepID=A0A1M6TMR6_9FIRM|nr:sigma-54 dependent transcriptional regulator [Desulforamulus aeronauticus]SHK58285.1 two-component system, NtrC family, response regulator [Desulforamulus aeronauticus DSM 10349]